MDKFCSVCKRLLTTFEERVVDGEKTAVIICEECGEAKTIDKGKPVYEHNLREDKVTKLSLNPYIKFDAALPRFTNIACSNSECPSKAGAPWDVRGMKLDVKNLVWAYQCINCGIMWQQASRAT